MNRPHIGTFGQGMPIVMLHGWGWHSGIWEPLIPILEKNFQLFLVDLPGFGKSPMLSKDYSIHAILLKILENVPEQAAWMGWSMGGLFATSAAIHFPHRVTHLINVASSPHFLRDKDWPGVAKATLEKFSHLLIDDHQKTLLDFLELQLRGSTKKTALFSELKKILFLHEQHSLPALLGGLALLRETDLRPHLNKITCPSLSIFGSLDTIVPSGITTLLPTLQSTVKCKVIEHSGHMPFLTRQNEFLDIIHDFLASLRV